MLQIEPLSRGKWRDGFQAETNSGCESVPVGLSQVEYHETGLSEVFLSGCPFSCQLS
jgi:hypothetical protein